MEPALDIPQTLMVVFFLIAIWAICGRSGLVAGLPYLVLMALVIFGFPLMVIFAAVLSVIELVSRYY